MKKINEMRTGFDRRQFSYTAYSPERRKGANRRANEQELFINRITDDILNRYVNDILEEAKKRNVTDSSEILSKMPASVWLPFQ